MPRSLGGEKDISLLIATHQPNTLEHLPYSDRAMNILFVKVSVVDLEAVVDLESTVELAESFRQCQRRRLRRGDLLC